MNTSTATSEDIDFAVPWKKLKNTLAISMQQSLNNNLYRGVKICSPTQGNLHVNFEKQNVET